jgi:hypothetical protein
LALRLSSPSTEEGHMGLTPAELEERTLHRRAVEVVIWGMPAVNYDRMYQAVAREAKGDSTKSSTGLTFRTGRSRP